MTDLIRRDDALAIVEEYVGLYDAIAALPAVTVGADAVLDAAHKYLLEQYGASPLSHPTDRARILAALEPVAAPDPAAIREALLSLPAVYAHQINTGVREVYDPLQRFYRMEDVLSALAPHVNEPPKSKHDADNVLTDADLIARLREIQGQAGLFASAAADRIEALVKERDAALASNRGLVRLNEMTEARAQRFEAALEEIASHDTGATAGLAHTAILALIAKGAAE